ncbi:MAG: hypothetical protein EAX96_12535 [Candidatus Lokiarchaeota archaeon]|nr:hypothetical protein [Candidatus Lokiarchaeota archaeon]
MTLPKIFSTFEYEIENPFGDTFEIIKDSIQQLYVGKKIKTKEDKWAKYFKAETSGSNPIFFIVECFKDGDGTYLRMKIGSFPQTDEEGNVLTQNYHYEVLNRILNLISSKLRIIHNKKILTCPICGKKKAEDARFCNECSDQYWSSALDETSQYIESFLVENVFESKAKLRAKIEQGVDETVVIGKLDEELLDESSDLDQNMDDLPKTELTDEIINCPKCGAYIDEKFQLLFLKGYDIHCKWCNFLIKKKYNK